MDWLLTDGPTWAQFAAAGLPLYILAALNLLDRHRAQATADSAHDTACDAYDLAEQAVTWCQQVHDVFHQAPQPSRERQPAACPLTDTNPIVLDPHRGADGFQRAHTQPGPHGATATGRHRRPR